MSKAANKASKAKDKRSLQAFKRLAKEQEPEKLKKSKATFAAPPPAETKAAPPAYSFDELMDMAAKNIEPELRKLESSLISEYAGIKAQEIRRLAQQLGVATPFITDITIAEEAALTIRNQK